MKALAMKTITRVIQRNNNTQHICAVSHQITQVCQYTDDFYYSFIKELLRLERLIFRSGAAKATSMGKCHAAPEFSGL